MKRMVDENELHCVRRFDELQTMYIKTENSGDYSNSKERPFKAGYIVKKTSHTC